MRYGLVVFLLTVMSAHADPEGDVLPDVLKPWRAWVLHDAPERFCPHVENAAEAKRDCVFGSRLELTLDDHGGRFTLKGHAYARGFVSLPGGGEHWPLEVRSGARRVSVVPRGESVAVELQAGDFSLAGVFAWDELPEGLALPTDVGLVSVSVRGKKLETPSYSDSGVLILQREAVVRDEERVEIHVQRLVDDAVPLTLTTHLSLEVSGKARGMTLGKILPEGFVPTKLVGTLPLRLRPDGHLQVQLRPGTYDIDLTARTEQGAVSSLSRPDPAGPWASGDEIWVFRAHPNARRVVIGGVASVDPSQAPLPGEWKGLPAYAVGLKDTLKLEEKRRGDAEPTPDQLALVRELWLDFDGGGYTARDVVIGALTQSWRLTTLPGGELGRAAVNGRDQFITRAAGASETGVELRQGTLALETDSRWRGAGAVSDLAAVGFAHDFASVSATLNLPPGWRLFSISGVDDVPETWMRHWTLLEFFLVLVLAFGVGRLYGIPAGVLAGLTFVLTFPEPDSPQLTWLGLLGAEALMRVIPEGRVRTVVRWARAGALLWLAMVLLPFVVEHVRGAIYPALAQRQAHSQGLMIGGAARPEPAMMDAAPMESGSPLPASESVVGRASLGMVTGGYKKDAAKEKKTAPLDELDRHAVVQTGPGVPSWHWNTLALRWSGPVEATQRLHLYLIPPWANIVLAFVRMALLLLLAARLVRSPFAMWPPRGTAARVAPAAVSLLLALVCLPSLARAETPSKELLTELRTRLTEALRCEPHCASAGRLRLEVDGKRLTLAFDVSAAATVSVPILGKLSGWMPDDVKVDGHPAGSLSRDAEGTLHVVLTTGVHDLRLEGPLPARDTVQLSLPLTPHVGSAHLVGWTLDGIQDGKVEEDLQLSRVAKSAAGESTALEQGPLSAFVEVHRTVKLGLTWEVTTQITRVTPVGTAVVLDVPLLPGESVTTADIRVSKGHAQVTLPATSSDLSWRSVLEAKSPLVLRAARSPLFSERWSLEASPLWHLEFEGLPPLHPEQPDAVHAPTWVPYPGETLTLVIARPEGAGGQSLTVDESKLTVSPGVRATDSTLTLVLRSSRGGQHVITLPEGALLQSASLGGHPEPLRQEGRQVAIPLVPGRQSVELRWREPRGLRASFTAPELALNAPSVNAEVVIVLPRDRWLLLTGGPRLGPAVLAWSTVLGVLIAAVFLSRLRRVPLGFVSWALLGLGLTQIPLPLAAFVAGWFGLLSWRGTRGDRLPWRRFDIVQVGIVAWTLGAAGVLFEAIEQGLLEQPDMQVEGNGSSAESLRWFVDRTGGNLPQPWVLSVPLFAYRVVMLLWALWLAASLLRWVPWAWAQFSESALWRPRPARPVVAVAVPAAGPAPGPPPASVGKQP